MLKVSIDIVPFGDAERTRNIGSLEISRTTPHDDPETYNVHVFSIAGKPGRTFQVEDHHYKDGAWLLIARALAIYCE